MTIELTTAEETGDDAWDELVRRSDTGTYFHQRGVLEVVAEHSTTTLHRLIGYKGQQPIGLLPVFERSFGPITMVFSPPPGRYIPGLGPLLVDADGMKRAKVERRNRRFIDACLDWLESEVAPRYTRIVTVPGYMDPRPFSWAGFTVTPQYTYHVDLSSDEEAVMASFRKSLRNDLRRHRDGPYSIERGGPKDVDFILEHLRARHEAQGTSFSLTDEYALDLNRASGEEQFTVYIARVDGERASGIISPRFDGTMHYWQGGGKPDVSLPINDLLHWEVMRDGIRDGQQVYDLVGANTRRLCRYKSKFNPTLRTYYELERGNPLLTALAGLYKRVN
ncbi:MAG: lipid II:glycine glycyltransferase FemX [Halobacteriota archaeon]